MMASAKNGGTFARNLRILNRFERGDTLADIGRDCGLTRERVRQIVASFGATPRHQRIAQRDASILAAIKADDLTAQEAADRFGRTKITAYLIGHHAGHVFRRDRLSDCDEIVALAEQVRAGASMQELTGGSPAIRGRLYAYCRRNGIRSMHGRHRDFSTRAEIVRQARQSGMPWAQVADLVSDAEHKSIGVGALYNWAAANLPRGVLGIGLVHQKMPRAERTRHERPRKEKPARAPRIKPEVIAAASAKEAAIANYGRASAGDIAAAHGVTRNSIIGYWFRARREGLISDVSTARKSEIEA